ncbi:hypothetical protein BOX15_Mlig016490g1 [Macrostomum lignano]|uniref:Uncharacterized protein n=1 Tax=Macrostomum lignano TaxID=282301 RepID=A0A267DGG9_9PLAT|nr:hypothetical protein BOX15_Mlig016490g1 [Macrostomum lignano]
MSLTGAETSIDAATSATWIEVQFAADPNPQATGAGGSQAMEKLLIDAQRESGQSSLAQSGSASPAIAGSGSHSPAVLAAGAQLQSSGGAGDWQRDWPTRFVVSQTAGSRQFQIWRFLSLRKTRLVRDGSVLLSWISHAASFLLGATSMYIICRVFAGGQREQRVVHYR